VIFLSPITDQALMVINVGDLTMHQTCWTIGLLLGRVKASRTVTLLRSTRSMPMSWNTAPHASLCE